MKKKIFHATLDGVEECKKRRINCSHKFHYGDFATANSDYETLKDNERYLNEVAFLESVFYDTRFENEFKHTAVFSFRSENSSSVRDFGQSIDKHIQHWQASPIIHRAIMSMEFNHAIKQKVTISRSCYIDKDELRFVGRWKIEIADITPTVHFQTRSAIKAKTKTIDLNFDNDTAIIESLDKVYNVFHEIYSVNDKYFIIDAEEKQAHEASISAKAQAIRDNFWCSYIALESEVSPIELWENGYGYFEGSDGDLIKASVNYKLTSFRAKSFADFLQSNAYYASMTPDAEIYVFDDNLKTGAAWSIRRENGVWIIVNTYPDGSTYSQTMKDAEDAYAHIYWHVIKEVFVDNQDAAFERAQYVSDLIITVENELNLNKEKVSFNWEAERQANIARSNGHDTKPFYAIKDYSLDKLHELSEKASIPLKRKK